MNFKADWSFLEKISMGAVSSKAVIAMLNNQGHDIIELERYSTSNKIWSTKIKRLRLPDLICLHCGKRIESRAKSTLVVKMSDNVNNPDRRWDVGLRDEDCIAFIQCEKVEGEWVPAQEVNLFETSSLRKSEEFSVLSEPKSRFEGSEKSREWKVKVATVTGVIEDIVDNNEKIKLTIRPDDGSRLRKANLKKSDNLKIYCSIGDHVTAKETIIAGVMEAKADCSCANNGQYDFLQDINSNMSEIRYAGVKALGHLPKTQVNVDTLKRVLNTETDIRIKLEAFASLIKLGEDIWDDFYEYMTNLDDNEKEFKMEFSLMLGELQDSDKSVEIIDRIIRDSSFDAEMKSAAVWGMKVSNSTLSLLLQYALNDDDSISSHAIAHLEDRIEPDNTKTLLSLISDDTTGGIVSSICLASKICWDSVVNEYLTTRHPLCRKWLLLTIGLAGRERSEGRIDDIQKFDASSFQTICFLWDYASSSIDENQKARIDFLKNQCI